MKRENLVRANSFSKQLRELSPWRRIAVDYPLLVRKSVAKKLANASKLLPSGYYLQVDSGYRDRKIAYMIFNKRPDIAANPVGTVSSHATGGAVDVTLQDINGKEINLSHPFKKYFDEPKLFSKKISKTSQNLRLILNRAMLKAGFAPHNKEYWHFSYGDERWTKYYKRRVLYKEITLSRRILYPLHYRFYVRLIIYTKILFGKIFSHS
jgi:D-alanyl-D-alanine dipeptidase